MARRDPVNRLHASPLAGITTFGFGVIGTMNFYDFACLRLLHDIDTFDDIGGTPAYLAVWGQAVEIVRRKFHKVILLDKKRATKWNRTRTLFRDITRPIRDLQPF